MNSLNTMYAGRRIKSFIMLIAFGILFTGCASQTKTIEEAGFLTDYSLLTKNEDPQWVDDWIYVKEGVDWKSYDKVMVDRVTYYFSKDTEYEGIQAEELIAIATAFNEQYIRAFEKEGYTLTDKPGPNTLRIRTAIIGLKPNEPVTGTISTIIPVGLGISAIKKATTGTHIGMGEAGGEAELLDSQTGEVLGAGIDLSATGKKYRIDQNITKWGQVEDITKVWAEELVIHLVQLKKQQ